MKLKQVTLATTAAMILAPSIATAAFTEATGGAWTGQLDFNGAITNTNPPYEFEVPQAAIDLAKDTDQYLVNGTVNGANTEWQLAISDNDILVGRSKATAATGGIGLWPDVSFSGTQVDASGSGTSVATGDGGEAGVLAYDIEQAHTAAMVNPLGQHNFFTTHDNGAQDIPADADAWLGQFVPGGEFVQDATTTWTGLIKLVARSDYTDVAGYRTATIKNAKVSFPTASIPSTWTASLPLTVTMK